MTSTDDVSNLANLFRGSSHDFCKLYYNIKQSSSHAMTSFVIYYSTDARKNEIYLLNKKCLRQLPSSLHLPERCACVLNVTTCEDRNTREFPICILLICGMC